MQISILYALFGGALHFTFYFIFRFSGPGFWTGIIAPIGLTILVLYLGIRAMRKTNHGWLKMREGFFTGMNISTGSGVIFGLLIWFYFNEISPEEARFIAIESGLEKQTVTENLQAIVLSWAFSSFLFTFVSGLPFAALLARLLRSKEKMGSR